MWNPVWIDLHSDLTCACAEIFLRRSFALVPKEIQKKNEAKRQETEAPTWFVMAIMGKRRNANGFQRIDMHLEVNEVHWMNIYESIYFLNQQWSQRSFLRMFATMRFDCTKRRRHLPISHTRAKMQLPSYLSPLKYGEHWKTLLQLIEKTLLWRILMWVSCQVSLALEPLPLPWPLWWAGCLTLLLQLHLDVWHGPPALVWAHAPPLSFP